MRAAELLHSPLPVHVFGAAVDGLVYARHTRGRDCLERVERVALPDGWCQLGPVGVLQVDRAALGAALSELLQRLGGRVRRASLVVPNAWVRSVVIDVESLPGNSAEADEVVRWRLKRVLPCRPEDVRLDYLPTGTEGKLLVVLALEKPLAAVEDAFAEAGVWVGHLEPVALALTALLPATGAPRLLVHLDGDGVALVLAREGRRAMVRYKVLPADRLRAATFLGRELARTLSHAGEETGEQTEAWLASPSHELAGAVERWAAEAGVAVKVLAVDRRCLPAVEGSGEALWPLLAVAFRAEGR